MGTKTVVIRASASAEIGGGHIIRCLALADELKIQGWTCTFACGPETLTTIPLVSNFNVITIDALDSANEPTVIRKTLGHDADVVIVDHYRRGIAFETGCRQWCKMIMVIDDLPSRPHDANILLDQSGGRKAGEYMGLVPPSCNLLLGPGYSLLRSQFSNRLATNRNQKTTQIPRVFVSMGATDNTNLTAIVIETITRVCPEATVDVMLSAKAPHLSMIREMTDGNGSHNLHVDTADPVDIMTSATFAVGTAGINLWERCALGIPSIIFIAAENQRSNAEHVIALGGGFLVGDSIDLLADELAVSIETINSDREKLHDMSKAALGICDGLGARRVADVIINL